MDDATKAVIGGWVRHALTLAAGYKGFEFLADPTIAGALVTLALAGVGLVWSTYVNKKRA